MPIVDKPAEPFFRRFRAEDPAELQRKIEQDWALLAAARQAGNEAEELATASRLGFGLTIAGDEAAAADILTAALALARHLSDHRSEIEVLLNLATARQYLDQRDLAQTLFQDALDRSQTHQIPQYVHFILHHQGRCHVEQGNIEEARCCFARALELRQQMGEPRWIKSTQGAVDAIDGL